MSLLTSGPHGRSLGRPVTTAIGAAATCGVRTPAVAAVVLDRPAEAEAACSGGDVCARVSARLTAVNSRHIAATAASHTAAVTTSHTMIGIAHPLGSPPDRAVGDLLVLSRPQPLINNFRSIWIRDRRSAEKRLDSRCVVVDHAHTTTIASGADQATPRGPPERTR